MPRSFYIIDGHAHIFRAFYAPFRELSSPSGEPTKATFVFTQMLLNLIEQRRPDYLAMAIDSGTEEGFRRRLYPQYKSSRPPPPPDFQAQEARILSIVRDAGIPIFVQSGFEADDLIATMVHRLRGGDWDIYLVSRDKDLRQLLDEQTRMYDPHADKLIDAESLRRELGYGPEQAVEVQTLMGDPVDDVPGVAGVGEKTAARLIQRYGSVDGVLQHLDELTPKLRESFKSCADMLPTWRQLVTLRADAPIDFNPEACRFSGLNLEGLRPHFLELGFTNLLRKAEPAAAATPTTRPPAPAPADLFSQGLFGPLQEPKEAPPPLTSAECDYRLVDSEEKLAALLEELGRQKLIAFDTETDALGAMQSNLIGLSLSWQAGSGFYVPVRGPEGSSHLPRQRVLDALRPVLENPSVGKVGHNIKYDLLVMRQAGVELRGIVMDTMVAAFLLDASRMQYGIDSLARDLLNFRKIATEELIGRGRSQVSMHRLPLEQVTRYAAEDADIAWRLSQVLRRRLEEVPTLVKLHDELETPLIQVLADMEHNGVAIDPAILKEQSQVLGQRIAELRGRIMQAAGTEFNPDSPKQLADVLFGRLGLKVIKKTRTGPSTDVEVLERLSLSHPVPRLILEYRSLVKLKNTYLDNLTQFVNPKTGRIHASFNQIGAATGRLSCSDPNLQNIPVRTDEGRRIRMAFVPFDREHNVLLTADYSQIELRVLAHFTGEPALLRAFEADEDIHAAVAAEVFGVPLDQVSREQRAQAKIINFGIIYGVSAMGLARRIEGLSEQAARELIRTYNKRFPGIQAFMHKCVMDAQTDGYVQTILGRRRHIPELKSPVAAQRNAGARMAINSVVQGSAADLIKLAMLHIHRRIVRDGLHSRMLIQVHDELVFETPRERVEAEAAVLRQEMTGAMKLKVPLKVEIGWGENWQEGK